MNSTETRRPTRSQPEPIEHASVGAQTPHPTTTGPEPIESASGGDPNTTTGHRTNGTQLALAGRGPNSHPTIELSETEDEASGGSNATSDQTATISTNPNPLSLFDPTLALAADILDDVEKVWVANQNRLRILTTPSDQPDKDGECRGFGLDESHPDVARLADMVTALDQLTKDATSHLEKVMQRHPLHPWIKQQKGLGDKQVARLLAAIGDPYIRPELTREDGTVEPSRPRTVSELRAYCVPAGELIATASGHMPIETIEVGERIYGADGGLHRVERVLSRQVDEQIMRIAAPKVLPLRVTANHQVRTARFSYSTRRGWQRTKLVWTRADKITTDDYLVVPRLGPGAPSVTEDKALLWGRYVGDGSASVYQSGKYLKGRCTITFGNHEDASPWIALAATEGGGRGGTYLGTTGIAQQLQFGGTHLALWYKELFGEYAHTKRLPAEVMTAGVNVARAFMHGYLSADGHMTAAQRQLANTVSPGLALQLQLLSTRLGVFPSVFRDRLAGKGSIRGREFQQRERYGISWSPSDTATLHQSEPVRTKAKYRQDEDYFYVRVLNVRTESYKGPVYDLSCGGSFLVNNVVVHNCGYHVLPASHPTPDTHRSSAGRGPVGGGGDTDYGLRDTQCTTVGVAPRRRRGQKSNWNETARKRAWLIADSLQKQRSKPCKDADGIHVAECACSPYRVLYDATKAKYADRPHTSPCVLCGSKGKPAEVGTPRKPGHIDACGYRAVAKAVLKDLWIEAKRLHNAAGEGAP